MSSVELFCMSPTLSKWEKLDQDTKDLFIRVSNFCIKHKKGNVKLSNIILKLTSEEKSPEWEYVTLRKGSVLYRGTKTIPTEENRATYYTPNIHTANLYIPSNKKGYLNVYKTKKELKLFKLDSVSNANKLLRETFSDKTLVIPPKKLGKGKEPLPGKTLYDIIRSIYTGKIWVMAPKEDKPLQVTKIYRQSVVKDDLVFSNWLCANGFNGYHADIMKQKMGFDFPAEDMICKPGNDIKLVDNIEMRQANKKKPDKLDDLDKKYKK